MAALVEPSDSAHHAAEAAKEEAGVSSATQDLSRRFEEMDYDHDGATAVPACQAVLIVKLGVRSDIGRAWPGLMGSLVHGHLNHASAPMRDWAGSSTRLF